jgi:hypothetical protein
MSPLRLLFIAALMASVFPHAVAYASTPQDPHAHSDAPKSFGSVPATLAVRKTLGPPPAGVAELKFRDVFKLPVGPKGLEPTDKLLALDGKRVRIVGFMVHQSPAPKGSFLLSPLPVALGDEDEGLADDLPPATLQVDLDAKSRDLAVPMLPGLLQFTGTLHVGMRADPATGRATPAQLTLERAPVRALRDAARAQAKPSRPRTKI